MRKSLIIVLLITSLKLSAQVCTGSLGDPTATINFGVGVGVGPPLGSQFTTYNYKAADCPDDGQYTINNKTSSCFSNTWHTLTEDHTPNDINGYMLIVNAKNELGTFYTFPINNLCPETTYEFSSFIINLIKLSAPCGIITKPNITFRVERMDGTLIQEYSTGFITETSNPIWNKYGFFFTNPAGVSNVVLKLINNSGGGCGNDLALDDITFRPCGPTIIAQSVGIIPSSSLQICEGSSATYNLRSSVSAGYSNPAYLWQVDRNDGQGWIDIPNTNTSDYTATIDNANINGYSYRMAAAEKDNISSASCRVYSNPITVSVSPKITANAGDDLYLLENASTKILASAPPNLTYKWFPSTYLDNPNSLQPIAKPLQTTTYKLLVTNPTTGCTAEDEVTIFVNQDIKIPNTFTPNGDGQNDLWDIKGLAGNKTADVSVFNRYGQLVYRSKGYEKSWDGRLKNNPLPTGMYYYIIDLHVKNQSVYQGSLLIVR
ncbi:gliding motility-associated C-terminal domain-containing protein [Pelobium sp.]|nr:gliding motility-associated C-terminal domain-containing protein [Pelobium sp.]MDA9555854.1 gliding motility-associated C-terminal domain-containing protein [Pelobium sp.]